MTFEKAMHDSCRELGLDSHIKTIEYKKDCHTYAEKMVGKRYRHFKGGIYIVTDIAVHSETEGIMVVYKSFDNQTLQTLTWVRPLEMFMSEVDKEKYPDVKQEMRFEELVERN